MSELEPQDKRKVSSLQETRMSVLVGVFFLTIVLMGLDYLGWLPFIPGSFVTFAVAMLVEYWIPPKPPVKFPVWVVRVVLGYLFPILLGTWLIPVLLLRWVWTPLAYGVPTFIMLLFVRRVGLPDPSKRQRRDALWKQLLFALGFAIFYGWFGSWALDSSGFGWFWE